ncbi:MAG: hypothetical protein ABSB55_03705 [Acidimicrobiales bacterium]|jgi:hypothetical protein
MFAVLAGGAAVVGASVGFAVDAAFGGSATAATDIAAVEQVFTEVNNFVLNSGTPPPVGAQSNWELSGDPVNSAGSGLAMPAFSVVSADGQPASLSSSEVAQWNEQELSEINQLFAPGPLHDRWAANPPFAAGTDASSYGMPGEASVTQWTSVSVSGNQAVVDADVNLSLENFTVTNNGIAGSSGIAPSQGVSTTAWNAQATLAKNSSGVWQIVSLNRVPIGPSG